MPPRITTPPTRTPLPSEISSSNKLTSLSLPPTSAYSYSTWVYPTESIPTFPSGFTPSPIPTWVVVYPFNASSSSSSFSSRSPLVTTTPTNPSDPGYNNIGDSPFYHWHDAGFSGRLSPTTLSFIVISCAVTVFVIAGILYAATRRVALRKRERAWRDLDPNGMFVDGVFVRRGPGSGGNGELGSNNGRMPYAEVDDVMADLRSGGAGSGFSVIPARNCGGNSGAGGTWSRGALGSLGGTFGVLGVAGSIRRHLGISVKKTTADLDEGYGGDDAQNPSSSPLSTLSSSRSRSESTTTTGSTGKGDTAANGNMPAKPTAAAAPIMPTPHIFEDGYSYNGHFGQLQGRNHRSVGPLEEVFENGDRPDSLQQSLAKQKMGWMSGGGMYASTYNPPSEERISTVSYQVW